MLSSVSERALFTNTDSSNISAPVVYPRPEHNVSRADISKAALKVLYTLHGGGFEAYLVGGGVRDLLLGRRPKDFDVATNATPHQIRNCFRRCRLIGRRFRLAHVRVGREIVEVATFRASKGSDGEEDGDRLTVDGRVVRDNVYGTLEEDAWRRDFSINSLYYSIADFSLLDYTGGMQDLKEGRLRLIGDPEQRFREDPVRMLRAIRFAARLGFEIDAAASAAIPRNAERLLEVSSSRLYEELVKLLLGGAAVRACAMLRGCGLFALLFPETSDHLDEEGEDGSAARLITRALDDTDTRIVEGKPVTPAFLFAALLWSGVSREVREARAAGQSETQAMEQAGVNGVARQLERLSLPRRCSIMVREIWSMQPRLMRCRERRAPELMAHPRFRAACDFLFLRARAGEEVQKRCDWWAGLQASQDADREASLPAPSTRRRRGRRRSRRQVLQEREAAP